MDFLINNAMTAGIILGAIGGIGLDLWLLVLKN